MSGQFAAPPQGAEGAKVLLQNLMNKSAPGAAAAKRMEVLAKEIERTTELIKFKIGSKSVSDCFINSDETWLEKLRDKFLSALEDFQRETGQASKAD